MVHKYYHQQPWYASTNLEIGITDRSAYMGIGYEVIPAIWLIFG